MAPTVRVQTNGKETIGAYITAGQTRLTALTNIKLFIRRTSDGYFFDWSDDTFKLPGSVVLKDLVLTEVDATNIPGLYHVVKAPSHLAGEFDFSAITNKVANDRYIYTLWQDGAPQNASNVPQVGELVEGGYLDFIDQAISDNATPTEVKAEMVALGLDHLVSVNPGIVPAGAGTYIRQIIDLLNAQSSYVVLSSFSYNAAADRLEGLAWAESGNLVHSAVTSCTVKWYDKDGTPQWTETGTAPDSQGFFKIEKSGPGLAAGQIYYAVVEVTVTGVGVVSGGKGNFTF